MWKSIVLCVSLFSGAALGLVLGARWVEAAALPAAAAIGLCIIGVVLILAAPTDDPSAVDELAPTDTAAGPTTLQLPTVATAANRTPPIPFDAIQDGIY